MTTRPRNNTKLTAKQIAQTYVLNDIIVHELIIEAIAEVEDHLNHSSHRFSKSDIISRICTLVLRDQVSKIFDISPNEVLKTIKEEYEIELEELVSFHTH